MNKKQKNLLIRIIIAAIFFVPLYLISEEIVHVELPKWAIIVLLLIPYLTNAPKHHQNTLYSVEY